MGARVLIVEDHELLAQSLVFALRADGMEADLCEASSGESILAAVNEREPDIVLLDLDLGGELGTSLSLIPEVQASGAKVVMVTGVTDRARLAECLEAGAIGLVSKAESFESLLESVREAVELGTLISGSQREELMAELRQQRAELRRREKIFQRLTARESAVLGHLMEGKSAEVIAQESFVSLATVRTQIRSLLQKLGVNSQLSAVALARENGWQPPEA